MSVAIPHGASASSRLGPARRPPAACRTRALAALVGAWLVLGGVLGMRHEARVLHVLDVRTGAVRHADAIATTAATAATARAIPRCRATGTGTATDGDLCTIATVLHQAGQSGPASVSLERPVLDCTIAASIPSVPARAVAAVYAFAPKTSPPFAA